MAQYYGPPTYGPPSYGPPQGYSHGYHAPYPYPNAAPPPQQFAPPPSSGNQQQSVNVNIGGGSTVPNQGAPANPQATPVSLIAIMII